MAYLRRRPSAVQTAAPARLSIDGPSPVTHWSYVKIRIPEFSGLHQTVHEELDSVLALPDSVGRRVLTANFLNAMISILES